MSIARLETPATAARMNTDSFRTVQRIYFHTPRIVPRAVFFVFVEFTHTEREKSVKDSLHRLVVEIKS